MIGTNADRCGTVHEGFGYGERNNRGVSILDFVIAYELVIANSYSKKKEDHLVTFKIDSRRPKSIIF